MYQSTFMHIQSAFMRMQVFFAKNMHPYQHPYLFGLVPDEKHQLADYTYFENPTFPMMQLQTNCCDLLSECIFDLLLSNRLG